MKLTPAQLQGVAGAKVVAARVASALGWACREQPQELDTGVDVTIEVVRDDEATGILFGAQVKSGKSFFKEKTPDGIIFRGKPKHLDYWLRHSLPIAVILHDPGEDRCYWQHVTEENIERTQKGWKMAVPFSQQLDETNRPLLEGVAAGGPAAIRLNQLRLERPWMELIEGSSGFLLEAEEWVNKSSGRGTIRLLAQDTRGAIILAREWDVMLGLHPYSEALPGLFPWADLSMDQTALDEAYDLFEMEEGIWDGEDGRYVTVEEFDDWAARRYGSQIFPYRNEAGEVDHWRLHVTLNELGRGFLAVERYLEAGN